MHEELLGRTLALHQAVNSVEGGGCMPVDELWVDSSKEGAATTGEC